MKFQKSTCWPLVQSTYLSKDERKHGKIYSDRKKETLLKVETETNIWLDHRFSHCKWRNNKNLTSHVNKKLRIWTHKLYWHYFLLIVRVYRGQVGSSCGLRANLGVVISPSLLFFLLCSALWWIKYFAYPKKKKDNWR